MEAVLPSKTYVHFYEITRRHFPENQISLNKFILIRQIWRVSKVCFSCRRIPLPLPVHWLFRNFLPFSQGVVEFRQTNAFWSYWTLNKLRKVGNNEIKMLHGNQRRRRIQIPDTWITQRHVCSESVARNQGRQNSFLGALNYMRMLIGPKCWQCRGGFLRNLLLLSRRDCWPQERVAY
jgi:hypothetical protein